MTERRIRRTTRWVADAHGHMLDATPDWLEVTGLSAAAAACTSLAAISHPEDQTSVADAFAYSAETGGSVDVRHRVRVAGGDYRWLRTRARPRQRADGGIDAWRCTADDVHAETIAERALVESEARLRVVLENIGDAVIAFGPEPGRGFANQAFLKLFGVDIAFGTIESAMRAVEILDENGWPLPPETRPMLRVLEGETVKDLETRLRFADGREIDVVYNGQPVLDADGKVELAVLTIRDVTVTKAAAAELRELNLKLVHASRVGAMGSVASAISHEIAQPLTVIATMLGGARRLLATQGAEAVPEAVDAMGRAEQATVLARGILERLRAMIRRRPIEMREQPIRGIVEDALLLAAPGRAERGRIHVAWPEGSPCVRADRVQIQQVILNLLRNAIEAGGRPGHGIDLDVVATADEVMVSVLDGGDGIDPAMRDKLFAPFNTTKADGTGIGLSICKSIVEGHGGRIWAEARVGGGSAFRFALPRLDA